MARPSRINGSKSIRFRVSNKMYDIMKSASNEMGMSISEICRSAINTYFMTLILNKTEQIKKEFMDYAKQRINS